MSYSRKDVDTRLEDLKNEDHISSRNAELIDQFVIYLKADDNVSESRIYKYLGAFNVIFQEYTDVDLDEATKEDIRDAVAEMNSSGKSAWTVRDYKVTLKKFYRTRHEEETERPDRVKKILNAGFMTTGRNVENQKDIEALEPEEIMEMVDAADNPRNKLMPLFFFETGGRMNEIRAVTLDDIKLNQKYAEVELITLKNDKGPRTLQLTRSVGLLQRWLEEHPRDGKADAPLFVNVAGSPNCNNGNGEKGGQMSERNIAKILSRLADEAGIEKRVTPHVFRHSAATHYGMSWSITRMMYWFGWKETRMADTYCHENEDRMRREKLAEEGIDKEENGKDATGLKECGRCGETWPPTQKYCGQCSLALDKDAAQEIDTVTEAGEETAQEQIQGL